jgi:hypothetical protein
MNDFSIFPTRAGRFEPERSPLPQDLLRDVVQPIEPTAKRKNISWIIT